MESACCLYSYFIANSVFPICVREGFPVGVYGPITAIVCGQRNQSQILGFEIINISIYVRFGNPLPNRLARAIVPLHIHTMVDDSSVGNWIVEATDNTIERRIKDLLSSLDYPV